MILLIYSDETTDLILDFPIVKILSLQFITNDLLSPLSRFLHCFLNLLTESCKIGKKMLTHFKISISKDHGHHFEGGRKYLTLRTKYNILQTTEPFIHLKYLILSGNHPRSLDLLNLFKLFKTILFYFVSLEKTKSS
ncbi:hypothetical protein QTP88_017698 [Uroleucon formosanum]